MAASAASLAAMAGTRIVMAANAMRMIHNVSAIEPGDADALRKTADLADKFNEQMVSIHAKRAGKSLESIRALMDAETFFTAKEAKAENFIDEIIGAIKMMAPNHAS